MLQSVTECYRVSQSISSASTWTNFWACFCLRAYLTVLRDVVPGVIAAVTAGFKAFVVVVPARRRLCRKEEFLANIFKDWEVGAGGKLAQLEALLLRVHPDHQDDLITLIG